MAKSIFGISASSNLLPQESIKDVAIRTIKLFISLRETDSVFSKPFFLGKNDQDKYEIDLTSIDESAMHLSELILKYAKGSIAEYEKEGKPTITFSRNFGFANVYQFFSKERKAFTLFTNFGSASGGGIGINSFSKEKEFSFDWYYSVLKCLVNEIAANVGTVSISNTAFIDLLAPLQVKYPLGWITYFSNDFEIPIPNDLEGMEYEHADKGKYLILTRSDFTSDKDLYFKYREKLISTIKYLKENTPGYAKDTA
jgi:hypothetical protein